MEIKRKLKLYKRSSCDSFVTRQIDAFVCLDVTIGTYSTNPSPLYWRLIDTEINLVEIGVERDTGKLISVTIVLYKDALYRLEAEHQVIPIERFEVPSFCLDLWGNPNDVYDIEGDYYDVPGRSRLEFGEDILRLRLFSDEVSYRVVVSSDLICEFNQCDELCAVLINNIKPEERTMLEQKFSSM